MKTQMTIGKKFALTGAFLIGMTLLLGVATLTGLVRINRALSSVADDSLAGVSACSKVEAGLLEMRGDTWRHVSATDPADKAYMEQEVQRLKDQVETELKSVESALFTDEERHLNQKIRPLMARYYQAWDNVREVSRTGRNAEAYRQYVAEATPAFAALKTAVGAETEYNRTSGAKDAAAARATENGVKLVIWAILIVSTFAGSGLLFLIVRRMNRELMETVSELSSGASQVTSAAAQIASTSQSLAQDSSGQAASVEETSASSEEINAMARKNTESTRSAAELAGNVQRKFAETSRSLDGMTAAMGEISGSSEKISKIIKVIDEIAFQTNILALNAAVEGEGGRSGDGVCGGGR